MDQEWELSSLYFGLAGMAFALPAVHDMLGDRGAGQAAARALDLVRSRFDGERWADQFELLGGNAGIALGAARAGDLDLLRYERVRDQPDADYAIAWPDHPAVTSARGGSRA